MVNIKEGLVGGIPPANQGKPIADRNLRCTNAPEPGAPLHVGNDPHIVKSAKFIGRLMSELPPDDHSKSNSLLQRGLELSAAGDEIGAFRCFQSAVELNPKNPLLHFNLGHSADCLGRSRQAISYYSRAIELDPTYAAALHNRGILHDAAGAFQTAIDDFSAVIRLDPTDAHAINSRGIAYAHLGRNRKAMIDYNNSIELDPQVARFYFNRARLHQALNDPDRAQKDYERALALDPLHVKSQEALVQLKRSKSA